MPSSSLRIPSLLKKGDKIGIIAPAGPVREEEIHDSLEFLKGNFNIVLGDSLFSTFKGYLSAPDSIRVEEIHYMFLRKDIKAVLCARGGYGSLRIIDKIDFSIIRDNPKIFMGHSDITVLLISFINCAHIVTFHGPMLKEAGRENLSHSFEMFMKGNRYIIDISHCNILRNGRIEGEIIGGNLSMILSLLGTPYLPSFKGKVLFIEEKDEPLYRIDRMFTQLRLSGIFSQISGLILGDFIGCGNYEQIEDLIMDISDSQDIGIISGFPAGHGKKNIPFPLGVKIRVDFEQKRLLFLDKFIGEEI